MKVWWWLLMLLLVASAVVEGFVLSYPPSCGFLARSTTTNGIAGHYLPTESSLLSTNRRRTSQLSVKNKNKGDTEEDDKSSSSNDVNFKMSPATLLILPLVALVGLDLVLNIFFMTKRTIEFMVFGKVPSTQVWFSNDFFL